MKQYTCTWGTVRLVLLIIFLTVPLASAGIVSVKAAVAIDRTKPLEDRMAAILDLGASADESTAPMLLGILRDASEETRIRTSAVLALTKIGTPRAEILRTYESVYHESNLDKNIRYTILHSLGRMKAVETFPLLTAALSSEDSLTRLKAVQALGALENEDALQLLASHLTKEDDYMVRAAAIRAVGQSETSITENILTKSLRSDPAPLVRYNAAIMLGKFKKLQPESQAAIEAALEDASPAVRDAVRGIKP